MKIHNIKSISDFEFEIPTEKGLYALTGENASGKSTVISCAATAFYNVLLYSYFGKPYNGSKIEFKYNGKTRTICSNDNRWIGAKESLGITGFFEGSLVFGNRFKDIDFKILKKLSDVSKVHLEETSSFIKENLGMILHDNTNYYDNLYVLSNERQKAFGLLRPAFYYEKNGTLACNVILPPRELQDEFARFVEQTEKIKTTIKLSLEKLELLKQSLLQKYFG